MTLRFVKKPIVIEAFRLAGLASWDGFPQWFKDAVNVGNARVGVNEESQEVFAEVQTLEGLMTASPGDYIIRGVKGELYPCKPDIFAATYEPVEG